MNENAKKRSVIVVEYHRDRQNCIKTKTIDYRNRITCSL